MTLSRRMLIGSGLSALSARMAAGAKKKDVYRFRTPDLEIEMTIEFHDGYKSNGFWFREQNANREFCLSTKGEENRNCSTDFRGSVAIAKFKLRTLRSQEALPKLREYVRTIDHDSRLPGRPPFERTITLDRGVGSDLQAFGYEVTSDDTSIPTPHGPWYLFRQDLFLEPRRTPFLVVYWKHALSSIRALDVIPGDETWAISE